MYWSRRIGGIEPCLALAIAEVESGFNKRAVSPKKASGIMQILAGTAALYGVSHEDLFDEDVNIQVGIRYLKDLLNTFNNKELAIAAYNCGPGRVIESNYRIPKIPETINYVRRVKNAANKYNRQKYRLRSGS